MQVCRKIVGKHGDPLPGHFPAQAASLDVENYVYEQLINAAGAVHDEVRIAVIYGYNYRTFGCETTQR